MYAYKYSVGTFAFCCPVFAFLRYFVCGSFCFCLETANADGAILECKKNERKKNGIIQSGGVCFAKKGGKKTQWQGVARGSVAVKNL